MSAPGDGHYSFGKQLSRTIYIEGALLSQHGACKNQSSTNICNFRNIFKQINMYIKLLSAHY